jgi:hypothetical protein
MAEAHAVKEHPVARRMLDKEQCRRLLEELDAPLVQRFAVMDSIDALRPRHLATPTVIKPRRGFNNRGVLALRPVGHDQWQCVLTGRAFDFQGIRGTLVASAVRYGLADSWIIEDLVEGVGPETPVDDVKLSLFGDRLACSFVRSNRPRGYRWFDASWVPVDTGVHAAHLEPSIPVPNSATHLTDIARTIARRLPVPFVRVDFLVGARQTVVGELTPYPGWFRDFTPEWDTILGMHYERAAGELVRSGRDVSTVSPREGA